MLLNDILNRAIASPSDFILECENEYFNKIDLVAKSIAKSAEEKPFVLISGPSGSGKTTSANTLDEKLTKMGFETHTVSLDNYFNGITNDEREAFLNNTLDLESPNRLNKELLNSQLTDLMNGKEIELPHFDFTRNVRENSGEFIKLHRGEIIILEGIHSLNPEVIEHSDDFSTKLYVSVRTRIEYEKDGEINLLHPSKLRLARRLIRDIRTRGRSPSAVIDLYHSVERGESLYIMPYKHRADFDIDTFVPYEPCVYSGILPKSLPEDEAKHPWLSELFTVLNMLKEIPAELVPKNSPVREFIGGGLYE